MATKPTTVPEWATDANYPAGPESFAGKPTKVAPPAGLTERGWSPKQRPPAQYLNDWMHGVGEWLAYLDAGEIDGDLHVTGNLTVAGLVGLLHHGARTVMQPIKPGNIIHVAGTGLQHAVGTYAVNWELSADGAVMYTLDAMPPGVRFLGVTVEGTASTDPVILLQRQMGHSSDEMMASTKTGDFQGAGAATYMIDDLDAGQDPAFDTYRIFMSATSSNALTLVRITVHYDFPVPPAP